MSQEPQPKVGIIMGSKSDWETMRHADEMLSRFGVEHECQILSAHRTPEAAREYVTTAESRGLKVMIAGAGGANDLVLFLLLGTLVWAYLSAVLDDISLVITWERWEGTIEHTLMAPVPRWVHLVGMSVFGVLHAIVRTLLIFAIALPFFAVDFSQADWLAAVVVMAVGSVSIAGIGILAGVLPLLYPERGTQMSFMAQAVILLISGVYYSVEVLPGWLQFLSYFSPATYLLEGIRGAIIDGESVSALADTLAILTIFGALLVPFSVFVFAVAERWAKRTGKLKRQG